MAARPITFLSALCMALLLGGSARAQSYYVDAEPPSRWRASMPGSEGKAVLLLGAEVAGDPVEGGSYLYLSPGDPNLHPIAKVYDDPLLDLLWRWAPGREAHAVLPAAGVMVLTGIRFGGQRVMVSAWLRTAGNSGAYAARQGFAGKGGAVGRGLWKQMIAAAGLKWAWDELTQTWGTLPDNTVNPGDPIYTVDPPSGWHDSPKRACEKYLALLGRTGSYSRDENGKDWCNHESGRWAIGKNVASCPAGWYWSSGQCLASINNRPLTQEEWMDKMASAPWPPDLPKYLPDGVTVEDPVINPRPSHLSPPAPFYVPMGDPVPNPAYDPSQPTSKDNAPQKQPGSEVTGGSAPGRPWRVNVRPVDKPITGPQDTQNPDPSKPPDPAADPASAPAPSGNKPSEKQPLLCEVFPNISACKELGTAPAAEKLQDQEINVNVARDGGWGPDSAACPADRAFGHGWTFSYSMVCNFATGVRPIVIAFSWLAAGLMVVGVARKQ